MPRLNPTATKTREQIQESLLEDNFAATVGHKAFFYGPPKIGKTRLAATLSKYWPKKVPAAKRITLKDAIWLSADANATDTLKALNIKVDQFPLWRLLAPGVDIHTIMRDVFSNTYQMVSEGEKSIVVLDSASRLDKLFLYYYERTNPQLTKSDKRDSFGVWRQIKADHEWFHGSLNMMPCDVIILAHAKIAGEAAMKKAKAESLPGGFANVIPDFGHVDSLNIYRHANSIVGCLQEDKGDRWLHLAPYKGCEAGSRFAPLHDEREPPDLGKLFAKIERGLK